MSRPQPDCSGGADDVSPGADIIASGFCIKLALRMKRRKTVSVTPAMGARIVAGAIWTSPIWRDSGTFPALGATLGSAGFSQNLCLCSLCRAVLLEGRRAATLSESQEVGIR